MNHKEIFYRDMENCKLQRYHIVEGEITNPDLKALDELYGYADALSIQNAKKHERNLLSLAVIGALFTLIFLLYDVAEWHMLIFECIPLILVLIFLSYLVNRWDSHRKYLEYRVLAESLRVQFFLSVAGIETQVIDIIPWFTRKGIPWIEEVLPTVPAMSEPQLISDIWIKDQKEYHKQAYDKKMPKERRETIITTIVIILTVVAYISTLLFEIFMMNNPPREIDTKLIISILKISLGTLSAIALFSGSYYGKLSLSDTINDHKRMKELYETVEEEISQKGETEEIIKNLAREFLIENSTWYAYQNKNKASIVF